MDEKVNEYVTRKKHIQFYLCGINTLWQTGGQFHHHFTISFCARRLTLIFLVNSVERKIWVITSS